MARARVFLLSPARLDGARGSLLFRGTSSFPVAERVRSDEGCPLGDVFAFISGLYFRGKLAYATAFARSPSTLPDGGALIITQNRGLLSVATPVRLEQLASFAKTDIHLNEPAFREPLVRDAKRLAAELAPDDEVVLLGSIASTKYVETLVDVFGERLLFPTEFVGRGDMSRGGLMLRAVEARAELAYQPVKGAVRKGKRPPKLGPKR